MHLPDGTLRHLQRVADLPDLSGTRYDLVEPLGRGGMGAVYRVRDRALDRDVALKVLTGIPDAWAQRRFETEAQVLARLEHPGIVPVHDIGTLPDGRLFYAMKLVRGDRLDACAARVETLSERLRVIMRVAEAVAFAHAHGVVHRDLTPANIMIGAFGDVLVMDWGVALVTQPNPSNQPASGFGAAGPAQPTQPHQPDQLDQPDPTRSNLTPPVQPVVGTPGFMAPEQTRGAADGRSDVYALGAVMAWWLAPDAAGRKYMPRPLASIVTKAMAADPSARYQTADAFAADIARFLDGAAVSAHKESALERVGRFARAYRVAILLVAGYLLMRIVLLLYRGL